MTLATLTAIACTSCGKTIGEWTDDGAILLERRGPDHRPLTMLVTGVIRLECHREVHVDGGWRVCRSVNLLMT